MSKTTITAGVAAGTPDRRAGRPSRRSPGFTLVEVMVMFAVTGVLAALAAPAIQQAREAARQAGCRNNLKQIALAMHNYHDTFASLPPGWVAHHQQPNSGPQFGWSAMLLPFIDQAPLYNRLDFDRPVPASNDLFKTRIAVYRCPGDPVPDINSLRSGYGACNYSGNFGNQPLPRLMPGRFALAWPGILPTPKKSNGLFCCNSSVRFRSIIDGTSNTLLVGERSVSSGAGIWMGVSSNEFENDQVTDSSHASRINTGYAGFSSRHPGGALFALADGRAKLISEKISSTVGENLGVFQKLGQKDDKQHLNVDDF